MEDSQDNLKFGFSGLINDDVFEKHITTIHKPSVHQYQLSLKNNSNEASMILLESVWDSHTKLFSNNTADNIVKSATSLLKTSEPSNLKSWKCSWRNFPDPETLFQQSQLNCHECDSSDRTVLDLFHKTSCTCALGLPESNKNVIQNPYLSKVTFDNHDKYVSEEAKVFKPKFGRPKQLAKNIVTTNDNEQELLDMDKIEEENKAHKSNISKISFKTAKEQLLGSNPAAKRTLGASRKASAKFISPMIGAQEKEEEKQQSSIIDERLKHLDPKMIELIESEIIDKGSPIGWEDIAGLESAKAAVQEAVVWPLLRPDVFTGLRRPPKGMLLFGPPGTGKTLIGKCIASQCRATFFSISASSLTSKWIGDGEKMVRALFAVARCYQPAVVFIDEIDSLLSQRCDGEHEASRRIKTEFLVQLDGAATGDDDRLLVVGATNRPQELDEAARRRLVKRLYIPLPETEAREQIVRNLLRTERHSLSGSEAAQVASLTRGFSGADMRSLCAEAAMGPVRALPLSQISTVDCDQVRPVNIQDFKNALQRVKPSVSQDDLEQYIKWNKTYGHGF